MEQSCLYYCILVFVRNVVVMLLSLLICFPCSVLLEYYQFVEFFYLLNSLKILFIYLAVLGLSHGMQDLQPSLLYVGSLLAACGIFSCAMWTLSCEMWELVFWPEFRPGLPALEAWSLSHWSTKEVLITELFKGTKLWPS